MATVQELIAKFKADTGDFNRKVQGVQGELKKTNQTINKTSHETRELARTTSNTASSMSSSFKIISAAAGAAAVAAGAFAIKVGSDMQQAEKRIEAMLGSAQDAQLVMDSLRQSSYQTGSSLISLANSYSKLTVFVDNGTLSLGESLEISKGLSSTTLALGASTEQLNQVMFGFSQAMGSGTVRAEEFNQVTEPLPGIINRMEEAAGFATGELRRMINDGEVTSEMFKDLLIPALQSFEAEAKQMADTLKAQQGILSNTFSAIGEDIFDYLESPIVDATKALDNYLQKFVSVQRASKTQLQSRVNDNISRQQDIQQSLTGDLQVRNPKIRAELVNELTLLRTQEADLIARLSDSNIEKVAEKVLKDTKTKPNGGGRVSKTSSGNTYKRRIKRLSSANTASQRQAREDPLFAPKPQEDWRKQIGNFTMETENEFDLLNETFGDMKDNVISGFIAMSQSGKSSFKDMARSIIEDLQRVIIKTIAMQAIAGITNAVAGSIGGASGSPQQTDSGVGFGSHGTSGFGVSGARAAGGSVLANRSYLVGEKGPEILTMGGNSGMIMSNSDSFGGGSGGGQVINIDARGASAGVENKIRQVMQEVQNLRGQVPKIAVASVSNYNSRNTDFLR